MSTLREKILEHNRVFVANGEYTRYASSKSPAKKLAVVACMDTRLVELLPAAMGLKNGDIKLIKNAGGSVSSAFDSAMRSLLVAVYLLGVEEIAVVGHYDCGAQGMKSEVVIEKMLARGVKREEIDKLDFLESWLTGFEDDAQSVQASMSMVLNHPLMPKDVKVYGFLIDPNTGRLDEVAA